MVRRPAWKWPIAAYLFTGGLAGGSAALAAGARCAGNHRLARGALRAAAGALVPSLVFLVEDLGRPERFFNMLRVFRPTSPMNMGSWLLAGFAPAIGLATVSDATGRALRVGRSAELVAGLAGLGVATYTAVLVADTAVPVWQAAGSELPFVFAGGAAASAGALALLCTPADAAGPAPRLALLGAALELGSAAAMERRLGDLGRPYRGGGASRWARASRSMTATGAALVALGARRLAGRRIAAVPGSVLLLGGAAAERMAVFSAGLESADDPAATVVPQRSRREDPG
ncbi:MAG: NrfD/PsrC family molybdoenzyme membrane anchor subunit [Acidimicrobiales bacterium]